MSRPKEPELRHRLEYFFFRRFGKAILNRPHEEVGAFGARLGRWGHQLVPKARKTALGNLQRVFPEMSAEERERIVYDCFQHFGVHFCELLSLERFDGEEALDYFELEGWHHIEELRERGEGFFLHSGHIGHWDMALFPFSILLRPFNAVVRPPNNPLVNRDVIELRKRLGAGIIEKKGAAFKMRSAYRRGENVGIIVDQHVRPSAGIRIPFLGIDAWTSPILAVLALRLRAPVVPFVCWPTEKSGHYRLEFRAPIRPEEVVDDLRGEDAQAKFTCRVLEEVENDIRRRPELWLWMHRRWRD